MLNNALIGSSNRAHMDMHCVSLAGSLTNMPYGLLANAFHFVPILLAAVLVLAVVGGLLLLRHDRNQSREAKDEIKRLSDDMRKAEKDMVITQPQSSLHDHLQTVFSYLIVWHKLEKARGLERCQQLFHTGRWFVMGAIFFPAMSTVLYLSFPQQEMLEIKNLPLTNAPSIASSVSNPASPQAAGNVNAPVTGLVDGGKAAPQIPQGKRDWHFLFAGFSVGVLCLSVGITLLRHEHKHRDNERIHDLHVTHLQLVFASTSIAMRLDPVDLNNRTFAASGKFSSVGHLLRIRDHWADHSWLQLIGSQRRNTDEADELGTGQIQIRKTASDLVGNLLRNILQHTK